MPQLQEGSAVFKWITAAAIAALLTSSGSAKEMSDNQKPTIVLVHGAFADSSSWNGVVEILTDKGYSVTAAANPLRGVANDAAYVAALVKSIQAPVVLVGHSYGGSVISSLPADVQNVKSMVFVSAFQPEIGESALELSGKFPGSSLAETLAPSVPLGGGASDLYIQTDKFPHQFAADVPLSQASLMAVAQRPVTDVALSETAQTAAWKHVPSWVIYGTADLNIPPAAMAFMAERANSKVTVVEGASHVVMVSHPSAVADVIIEAAEK